MKITPDTWNDILTLMAAIILADETVLENEIECFQKNARLLATEIEQPIDMDDTFLKRWFDLRRDDIAKSILGPTADSFIMNIALSLEGFPAKTLLLNGLLNISASDADIHKSEVDIVNLTAAYWGLPPQRSYRAAGS